MAKRARSVQYSNEQIVKNMPRDKIATLDTSTSREGASHRIASQTCLSIYLPGALDATRLGTSRLVWFIIISVAFCFSPERYYVLRALLSAACLIAAALRAN